MSRIILKTAAIAVAIAITLSIALTSCDNAQAQDRTIKEKWEYKITYPSISFNIHSMNSIADEMSVAGAEGWELVSVTSSNNGTWFYFKRRLQ